MVAAGAILILASGVIVHITCISVEDYGEHVFAKFQTGGRAGDYPSWLPESNKFSVPLRRDQKDLFKPGKPYCMEIKDVANS